MIAAGRLISSATIRPLAHPGNGRLTTQMRKPIAKRSKKAPITATRLSGKDMGSINRTSSSPKTKPQRIPSVMRFMAAEGNRDERRRQQDFVVMGRTTCRKQALLFRIRDSHLHVLKPLQYP